LRADKLRADKLRLDKLHADKLRLDELRRAVLVPGRLWSRLDVVQQTGSTNDDLLTAARAGAAEGTVLVAEHQTRGRGRQGRQWESRTGSALIFSVLLRPAGVPPADRGWLPLLTGVAVARALREVAGVDAGLKWPNDVLAGGAKLAGILAEQGGEAIVVGVGLNVAATRDELPPPGPGALPPTSLAVLGGRTGRETLLAAILAELEDWYRRWTRPSPGAAGPGAAGPGAASPGAASPGLASPRAASPGDAESSGLRAEYLRCSVTVGRQVRVELPGGTALTGMATGIDPVGRLIMDTAAGPAAVSAGDVIHVRTPG